MGFAVAPAAAVTDRNVTILPPSVDRLLVDGKTQMQRIEAAMKSSRIAEDCLALAHLGLARSAIEDSINPPCYHRRGDDRLRFLVGRAAGSRYAVLNALRDGSHLVAPDVKTTLETTRDFLTTLLEEARRSETRLSR